MQYCPYCGNELGTQDDVCGDCGEAIPVEHHGSETVGNGNSETSDRSLQSESTYRFALTYPFENGVADLLKGGLTLFFLFLIVPLFTFSGYLYRLGRGAALGDPVPPSFDDWAALTKDGFFFVLTYATLYVGSFLIWLFTGMGIVALTSNRTLTGIFGVLFMLILSYLYPAVLTVYVATDSMREAFTPSRIGEFALTGTYLKAWLMYLPLVFILSTLITFSLVTIVGVFFALALTGTVIASYWGHVYYRSTATGDELTERTVSVSPSG